MFTYLIKKSQGFICGNCRMAQKRIENTCWFCGYIFSNYEEILIKNYKDIEQSGGK